MESHIKQGKAFLQRHKPNKKWKPVLLSLVAPSSSGVGRLEIREAGGGGDHSPGPWRHRQLHADRKVKVIRLSELNSVLKLPPNAEAYPMENMSAFCVETQERTLVFAALKGDCVDWVDKLCQSSFQREESSGSTQVHMEDNHIYVSVDEAPQFWVMIQKTDAATRCGLKGSYCLQVEPQSLLLKDAKKKTVVYEWPYELLRRYGADKVAFNIEAGRRCESGPGTFSFETQQAAKIFSLIQSHIQQRATAATAQTPDPEKVTVTSLRAHSPLPKIPDAPSLAAIMDTKLRMQDRRSPAFDNMAKSLEESTSPSEGPPPITLMPLPSVPTHDITSRDKPKSRSDAIYADPNDCYPVSEILTPTTAKYIDPVKVLPLKPPCAQESAAACPAIAESRPNPNINVPDLVYSEVLDSISSDQSKRRAPHTADEPIYSEPVIKADSQCRQTEPKPDPFAHLYAQVCKAATLGKNSASATTSASSSTITSPTGSGGEPVSDVIYDNLGII